jgi:N-terminal acetyltransferase B complex non-catalytic subunit
VQAQALKAYVLTHLSSPTTTEEATQIARALSEKSPPPLTIDILRLLTRVWGSLGQPEEVTKIWERAVKSQPQNEDLAKEWFWGMIRTLDWRGAQKAAMNLQKTYIKRREYWFWAVVASLLLHVGDHERVLSGNLTNPSELPPGRLF